MAEILANTYSIVGRCGRTGEMGAAVASAVPAVGAICLYLRPGVGAASTQSWVNPYLASTILDSMADGLPATAAVTAAMQDDPAAHVRQIGAIGNHGPGSAFTGSDCTPWCGQQSGEDFAVQGNMLTGPEVIEAMAGAFRATPDDALDHRLLQALVAAQAAGGDKRGRQSAALKVVGAEAYARVDLRVDEHADPVTELARVHRLAELQLAPFVAGMPRRDTVAAPAPAAVTEMLLRSPPERPGGGGSSQP